MRSITLVGERKLIFEVNKLVIDRRCGKHQYLRFHTGTNDFVQKLQIAVFFCVLAGHLAAVAEIMTFINDNKIIVSPVQAIKINTV